MKVSVKIVAGLVLLFCVHGLVTATSIEFKDFKTEDMEKILTDINSDFLIHVYKGECKDNCHKALRTVEQGAGELKGLKKGLNIHSINATGNEEALEGFGVTGDYGVFFIHKTHSVRIDGGELEPSQKVDIQAEVRKLITKQPHQLNTLLDLQVANQTNRYINVFIGLTNSTYWTDIELLAMTSDKLIYYTTSTEIQVIINEDKPDSFVTFDAELNSTAHLGAYPEYEAIQRFLPTANSKVPQNFNLESLRVATQSQYPVIIIYGETSANDKKLSDLLLETQERVRPSFFAYRINDRSDETQQTILDFCTNTETGLKAQNLCILLSSEEGDGRMYRYIYNSTSLTPAKVLTWLDKFLDGKLSPYYRSEAVSEKYTQRVRNLNSYTAEEFMAPSQLDTARRVILFYSTEDSSITKQVQQALENVSTEFDEREIKFGRLNLDLNEPTVPGAESGVLMMDGGYTGFEANIYKGDWSEDSIRQWIKQSQEAQDAQETLETQGSLDADTDVEEKVDL